MSIVFKWTSTLLSDYLVKRVKGLRLISGIFISFGNFAMQLFKTEHLL